MKKEKYSFEKLTEAVFEGNVTGIHSWFKNYECKTNSELSKSLCNYILDQTYFFNFRSQSFNIDVLKQEKLKRQLPILSYLGLKEQLSILSSIHMDDEVSIEHFKILNYNKSSKDQKIILECIGLHSIFTRLFNKEKFSLIDEFESFLDLDIKSNRHNHVGVCYKVDNASGIFNLNSEEYNSCPTDDIIFNYSNNKMNYMKSKGINLPDIDYVTVLKEKMLKEVKNSSYFSGNKYSKEIEEKVNNYSINYLFLELNKNLTPQDGISKKINKL